MITAKDLSKISTIIADNRKIAVLIDGDNAEAKLIDLILNEAAKFGQVTIKRIYADFTTPQMHVWKDQLNKYAIRPMQKFAYTKGKNSTDSALIIDAMDIMHSKLVDGFCIVSSDSDYTGIAHRVREEGFFVMGIGKSQTPEAFVNACEKFTYTEILSPKTAQTPAPAKLQPVVPKTEGPKITGKIGLTNLITKKPIAIETVDKAFEMVYDELTDLALATRLLEALKKVDPTFDIRNYGHNSFRKFIEALKPNYEVVLVGEHKVMSVKKAK